VEPARNRRIDLMKMPEAGDGEDSLVSADVTV
jgi:hypothetical protein